MNMHEVISLLSVVLFSIAIFGLITLMILRRKKKKEKPQTFKFSYYMNPPEFDVEDACKRLTEHMVKDGLIPKEITDLEFMDKAVNNQITKEYVENLEKHFNDAGILPMKLK